MFCNYILNKFTTDDLNKANAKRHVQKTTPNYLQFVFRSDCLQNYITYLLDNS